MHQSIIYGIMTIYNKTITITKQYPLMEDYRSSVGPLRVAYDNHGNILCIKNMHIACITICQIQTDLTNSYAYFF